MLCHRHGEYLETWATMAQANPSAVTAGLTVPYSSGAVEGHVTLKMIKRQMYGRAKPDQLRKRVLLAD
jgi:transposase